jgi:adenylate cyclase
MKIVSWNIIIAVMSGAVVALSFWIGLFGGFEHGLEDLLSSPKSVRSEVVIVAIDNESISRLGAWPFPRSVFADAFNELSKNPPLAVGLDVMLSEPSRLGALDDAELAAALVSATYPVVLPIEAELAGENDSLKIVSAISPLPEFRSAGNVALGHVNLLIDSDGVARRFPMELEYGDGLVESWAEKLIKAAGLPLPAVEERDRVERVVFSGFPGSVRRIPFWRLLQDGASADLAGKIVMIGVTAPDLHDEQLVPLSRGVAMPGVEIQANIANMLTAGYRLRAMENLENILWICIAALIPGILFLITRESLPAAAFNLMIGLAHLVAIVVLYERGIMANILHINAAWVLSTAALFGYKNLVGEREKKELEKTFSKYVSREVLAHITEDPKRVTLGGEEKEITLLFSDIRGFTTLSEKMAPCDLIAVLNKYFSAMTEEILAQGGVLDKYIGDAIMAFWGAPIADPDQADHALAAARGMLSRLKKLNEELRAAGEPEINIGIGLYTGQAVVGNVGSEQRLSYTAIGDTVNVASRLEGLTKEYGAPLIIGAPTKEKIKGNFNFRRLGGATVKGRKEPIEIYTID